MRAKFGSLVLIGCFSVSLLHGTDVVAQSVPQAGSTQQQAITPSLDLNKAVDILRFAMSIRTVPLDGFTIPAEQRHWDVRGGPHGGVWILTYSTEPNIVFSVQAFSCENNKWSGQDATILAPAETAAAFYKANTTFLSFDVNPPLACSRKGMAFELSDTNDPKVKWITSHSRAIRQMANWMRYLNETGDSKRAADFFATAFEKELQNLKERLANSDHTDTLLSIDSFEDLLPRQNYLPGASLTPGQRSTVRAYLQTVIQTRKELSVFTPNSEQNIRRYEELLQQYR